MLEELAFAGITEYARQWLLLSRRIPYREGSGLHELYLIAGGSAGHSGRWALELQEGVISDNRKSREWRVKVSSANSSAEPPSSTFGSGVEVFREQGAQSE